MSYIVQHIRSTEEGRRPRSSQLVEGQIAVNVNDATPGIFLTTTEDNVIKIGPAHVGMEEPLTLNSGLSKGELWYNTGTSNLNVFDGSKWTVANGNTFSSEQQTLSERLDALEVDRATLTTVLSGDEATLTSAKQYTDDQVVQVINDLSTKVDVSSFENLGDFTGNTIADGSSVRSAFQQLETAIEAAGGGGSSLSNIVDGAQGVEVTGRVAAEGLDLSVGGQITAAGCSIDFGSATISFSGASIGGLSSTIRGDVDLHLNQNTATDGQILSWNATGGGAGTGDYEWVSPAAAGAETDTLDTVTGRGATTLNDITVGKCYFGNVFSVLGDLPSAATHHGMFAHVHSTGHGYFAHNNNWVKLANHSELPAALTQSDVLTLLGVGTYADNAAAAGDGLSVGDVYFNSTTNKLTSVTA